jgi:hypothetical protein
MDRRMLSVFVLTLAACSQRAPAVQRQAAEPPLVQIAPIREPVVNPYVPQLQERRRAWQARGLRDYVFVLTDYSNMYSAARENLRVVVRDGHVVSARSLSYGGSTPIERVPTMDELFDRAQEYASFGNDGVPARFVAEYDEQNAGLRKVSADGRREIADDESSFFVSCFSTHADGCSVLFLRKPQCRAAGGWLAPTQGEGCERNGWSIGLVSDRELCCRTFSADSSDEITAAQCKAADGREEGCRDVDMYVGSSQLRDASCCRTLYRSP